MADETSNYVPNAGEPRPLISPALLDEYLKRTLRRPSAERDVPPIETLYGVEKTWGGVLGKSFTGVSNYFLENAHRLCGEGARGLTPTETLVIIQIMRFKWDEKAPFPSLTTIAKRMSLSVRTIRETVRRLEELGLLRREFNMNGGSNRYHFDGLFQKLEALMAADAAQKDAQEEAAKKAVVS